MSARRILVVEEEEPIRQMIDFNLRRGGVEVEKADGSKSSFTVTARLDTPVEINYWRNGGILQTVLRKLVG